MDKQQTLKESDSKRISVVSLEGKNKKFKGPNNSKKGKDKRNDKNKRFDYLCFCLLQLNNLIGYEL